MSLADQVEALISAYGVEERMRAMSRLQRFVLQQLLDHRPKLVVELPRFRGGLRIWVSGG